MAQTVNFEQTSGGPERLTLENHLITISQRMIRLGNPRLRELGLAQKDLPGFSENVIDGAIRINSMLEIKAAESNDPSVNAFYFDLEEVGDLIFLKIPMHTEDLTSSALVMLKVDQGSGKKFMDALQSPSMDQTTMHDLLTNILKINRTQTIQDSHIIAKNLVIFPQSTLEIAEKAYRERTDARVLYQQHDNQILVRNIPAVSEPTASPLIKPDGQTNPLVVTEHAVKQDITYGEKPYVLQVMKYGKVFLDRDATDFEGITPHNNQFEGEVYGWVGAGKIPLQQLDRQIRAQQLTDKTGLLDVPITFMCQDTWYATGVQNTFQVASHYQLREHLLQKILGNFKDPMAISNRAFVNYEQMTIGGRAGDPYPHTGYDIFALLKHPHFWTRPNYVNNERLTQVVNPRFPVSNAEGSKAWSKDQVALKETWGFPVTYEHSDDYFPLAAKLLVILHDTPKNWGGCIAIVNGFQEEDSHYLRAVKKLDFMRFMHDLRGRWIRFSTSPNLGETEGLRDHLIFADKEYMQNGARYTDTRPIKFVDMQKLELDAREEKILALLKKQFSGAEIPSTPKERYTEIQKEIESVFT